MDDKSVDSWLDELASGAPAPGGGAAAAMSAALGAALVSMVCHLTLGRRQYADVEPLMTEALAAATEQRARAVRLAEEDAAAFDAVAATYRLPKDSDAERETRSAAIQDALRGAADVPLRTAELAAEIIALAARIGDAANVNALADVAVAAATARAALTAAAINVEINLASMADPDHRDTLRVELARHSAATADADALVIAVRERINR